MDASAKERVGDMMLQAHSLIARGPITTDSEAQKPPQLIIPSNLQASPPQGEFEIFVCSTVTRNYPAQP